MRSLQGLLVVTFLLCSILVSYCLKKVCYLLIGNGQTILNDYQTLYRFIAFIFAPVILIINNEINYYEFKL